MNSLSKDLEELLNFVAPHSK